MLNQKVVAAVKYVMPHGLVQQMFRSNAVRRRLITAHNAAYSSVVTKQIPYSYKEAVEFHCARGLTRGHVVAGSMPESSLDFCSMSLDDLIPKTKDGPLIGLHVGNFLGVSLGHFANYARRRSEKSVVMSIDPNLTHRGIERPQEHVIALLNHFGLQKNAIVSVGYSTHKSLSNDGFAFVGENGSEYDPYAKFEAEQACEDTLANLALLSRGRFDFAVVDGNHEGSHLRREAGLVGPLLKPGGILILDDVSDAWADIKDEYDGLSKNGWQAVGADGRVGLLQRSALSAFAAAS
jgi:hypothetical protein